MRQHFPIPNGRFVPHVNRAILAVVCLAFPATPRAADEGETIPLPTPYITYILTPGKLTGKEFTLEKTLWREFRFDPHLINHKPKEIVSVRLSLRGGYRAYDLFGHDEFEPKEPKDVATGWLPQSSGSFLIFPDESKEHLPKWIPERTRLIRVPLIKQYGDMVVNAYDLPLGLDRVAKGDEELIPFQLTPTTDAGGKKGVRLTPAKPLISDVYFAYSLPKDTQKYEGLVHGLLFAVGTPGGGITAIHEVKPAPDFSQPAYRQDNPFWRSGNAPKSTEPDNPQLGDALGNCTWYANGRLRQLGFNKDDLDKLIRDASKWDDLANTAEIPISKVPTEDAIAQTDSGANGKGHVAVVEKVNADGTITISESSFAGNNPSPDNKWNFLYRERTVISSLFPNFIQVRKGSGTSQVGQGQTTFAANVCLLPDVKLARDVMDYALLSDAVYKEKSIPNWELLVTDTCPINGMKCWENFQGTSFQVQVYRFKGGNKLAVVFRGTEPTSLGDWKADVLNFFNGVPEQYEQAVDFAKQVIDKAGSNYEIVFTGHSLGGGLASYAALRLRKTAIVFNAAGLGKGLRDRIPKENWEKQKALVRNIDLIGDPVSGLGGQVGIIYALQVPPSLIGHQGFVDNRSQMVGVLFAFNPDAAGEAKAINLNPLDYHYIAPVIEVLQSMAKY